MAFRRRLINPGTLLALLQIRSEYLKGISNLILSGDP